MDPQALGRYLRQTREAKELTLDQAEAALKIRRRILESFEVGDFALNEFAPIQIRGFVRNYARYLDLDEDRVLAFYEEALEEAANGGGLSGRRRRAKARRKTNARKRKGKATVPVAARSITDTQPTLPVSAPQSVSTGLADQRRGGGGVFAVIVRVLVAIAALAVIAFVIVQFIGTDPSDLFTPDGAGDGGPLLTVPPGEPTFTLAPTALPVTPTVALPLQPQFTGQGVLVSIEITQRAYLIISADGVEQYRGLARIGDVLEIPANESVGIVSGNAEGMSIVYNGERQAVFGARGQRVELTFTREGVDVQGGPGFEPTPEIPPTELPSPTPDTGALVVLLTPTATDGPSPTPSDTPTVTNTPTQTLTPSITPTASDTPMPSATPSQTVPPTQTLTPSRTPTATVPPSATPLPTATFPPTPTAILPPRIPPPDATATKVR